MSFQQINKQIRCIDSEIQTPPFYPFNQTKFAIPSILKSDETSEENGTFEKQSLQRSFMGKQCNFFI